MFIEEAHAYFYSTQNTIQWLLKNFWLDALYISLPFTWENNQQWQ